MPEQYYVQEVHTVELLNWWSSMCLISLAQSIFDALMRQRWQLRNLEKNSNADLYDFWIQISAQCFDAQLQIFFDIFQYLRILMLRILKDPWLMNLLFFGGQKAGKKQGTAMSNLNATWTVNIKGSSRQTRGV